MSVELVTGTFEGHVGETFAATPSYSGEPLELVLSSCDESAHARPDHPAFSLTFLAPGPEHLEQQIFALEHAELGQFDLFLVPLGPHDGRMRYEAVIN
jgi:hypothetical protein